MISRIIHIFEITFLTRDKQFLTTYDIDGRECFDGEARSLQRSNSRLSDCRYFIKEGVLLVRGGSREGYSRKWLFKMERNQVEELLGKRYLRIAGCPRVWSNKEC